MGGWFGAIPGSELSVIRGWVGAAETDPHEEFEK
jgi:hypothetical protein